MALSKKSDLKTTLRNPVFAWAHSGRRLPQTRAVHKIQRIFQNWTKSGNSSSLIPGRFIALWFLWMFQEVLLFGKGCEPLVWDCLVTVLSPSGTATARVFKANCPQAPIPRKLSQMRVLHHSFSDIMGILVRWRKTECHIAYSDIAENGWGDSLPSRRKFYHLQSLNWYPTSTYWNLNWTNIAKGDFRHSSCNWRKLFNLIVLCPTCTSVFSSRYTMS